MSIETNETKSTDFFTGDIHRVILTEAELRTYWENEEINDHDENRFLLVSKLDKEKAYVQYNAMEELKKLLKGNHERNYHEMQALRDFLYRTVKIINYRSGN